MSVFLIIDTFYIVNNNGLLNNWPDGLLERLMGRVVIDVVVPILQVLKLDDESILDAVLHTQRSNYWSRRPVQMDLTCKPSGELSFPPLMDLM